MTTDILKDWMRDLPMQFLGKKNIEVLIKAFARQMQELDTVFDELNSKTDLDTAMGQNLDYVGTIIPLTRKEARELAGLNVEEPVMSDERYRQFLRYKLLVNTNECTYYDIMRSIEILWDVDRASYHERPDRPATIFIGLPLTDVEKDDPAEGRPSIMKPGGVGFIYVANYAVCIDHTGLERFVLRRINIHLSLPFFVCRTLDGTWRLDGEVYLCQKRRYQFALRLNNVLRVTDRQGSADMALELRTKMHTGQSVCVEGEVGIHAQVREEQPEEKAGMRLHTEVGSGCGDIGNTVVTNKTRDFWFLDGGIMLDGTRNLDSVFIREEI